MDDSEDTCLIRRAVDGDAEAFADLVRRHHAAVFRVAASILGRDEAEDVTQEVFLRVFERLDTFEGRSAFRTWLYRIATFRSLNRLRSNSRRRTAPLETTEPRASAADAPAARAQDVELRGAFRDALAKLPEAQRAVVVLRGVEGLSFEEVARALEIPVPTAQSRMSRARQALRGSLAQFLPSDRRAEAHDP